MASAITSCISCVLGAASTTILSFPYSIIQTFEVQVTPRVIVQNGTSVTIGADTTTIQPEIASSALVGGQFVATFDSPDQLTWTAAGTVLTYPTVYIEYLGFDGASATASGCAESITPTAITLPSDVVSASLVYPLTAASSGFPSGLLGYLDSLPGFTSQLGGPAGGCAATGPVVAPSPSASASLASSTATVLSSSSSVVTSNLTTVVTATPSSSSSTSVTTLTSTSTPTTTEPDTTTTLPPSTTITTTSYSTTTTVVTSGSTAIESVIVSGTTIAQQSIANPESSANPTEVTVTRSTARVFNTITPVVIVSQGGSTRSETPTALPISLPPSASVNLGGFLSYLSSITTATTSAPRFNATATLSRTPFSTVNTTSTTYALYNGTSTTYAVPYTGAAAPVARPAGLGWVECIVGLAIPALL